MQPAIDPDTEIITAAAAGAANEGDGEDRVSIRTGSYLRPQLISPGWPRSVSTSRMDHLSPVAVNPLSRIAFACF